MEPCLIAVVVIVCILFIILFFVIFKLYLILSAGWDRSATCLIDKTTIVTGSNTGIGYNTALDFAKRGARVILACRDPRRAEEARTKIVEASGNSNVVVKLIDLGSLQSVRDFAKDINSTEERLDILVNNAGTGGFGNVTSVDGLSKTLQINHFGPFLLTLLLIDLLKKSAPSRVVTVSSEVARLGRVNLDNLNSYPTKMLADIHDYANSKLCNLLFMNELARRLKNTGVDANSVHPGVVQTELFRNFSSVRRKIENAIEKMVSKTTEAGAQTSIYVAVSKDIAGVSGAYFVDCKQQPMLRRARDEELARKLWEKCEQLLKLTPEEKVL